MDDTLLTPLAAGAAALGAPLDADQRRRFDAYQRELLLWNRRINLVSDASAREVVARHFLDALTPLPWVVPSDGRLIDLGSGGGFPGLPLRIALPGLQVTLVEALRKKSSFLAHVVRTLDLAGVTVLQARVEDLIGRPDLAGRFDVVISRAAFKLPELVPWAARFLAPGGRLIALKGPDPAAEMAAAAGAGTAAGMILEASREVALPEIISPRKIIIYKRAGAAERP